MSLSYKKQKRIIDFFASFFLFVALLPILAVVGVSIYFTMGSPIFFCQRRIGFKEKSFTIIKFRTMEVQKEQFSEASDELRLTSGLGKFLRSSSLDELPELLNVIRGDMSLVGPRPLLEEYLALYSAEQLKRHDVRPGITGLAQVSGRNSISWAKKLNYDIDYVENMSLRLDFVIIFKTFRMVIKRVGITDPGSNSVEKFKG